MNPDYVFTSESVTEGHPDKLCDQISDAVVGRCLRRDPLSRVVAECAVSNGIVFVSVKHSPGVSVDIPHTAREIIREAGYDHDSFNARTCTVMTSLAEMARPELAPADESELGDEELESLPAQDQVTVFGFACDHTPALMPMPIWLSHKLARGLAAARIQGDLPYLGPDGKTQVAVEFRDRRPHRIYSLTVVASPLTEGSVTLDRLREDIRERVIDPTFEAEPLRPDGRTRIGVNPEGSFLPGGPAAHAGLTGRKTADDTYGEYARNSSAALSGKDPSRIDRVGAYAARYAAKNVVAAGLAEECEVWLSYSIGLARPVSVQVETFGTGRRPEAEIVGLLARHFDFRPAAIVRDLGLRRLPSRSPDGFYRSLAAYGHMGRTELDVPWERTDRAAGLRS